MPVLRSKKSGSPSPITEIRKETVTRIVPGSENQAEEGELIEEQKPERPDFWLFMAQTTEADWSRENYSVYLYRVDPSDARRQTPRGQRYLELICRPFTIEDVRARYGGGSCLCSGELHGHYKYMMTSNGRLLYSGEFSIDGPAKPRLDAPQPAAESLGGNHDLQSRLDKLAQSVAELGAMRHPNPGADLSAIAVNKMVEMIQATTPKPPSVSEFIAAAKSLQSDGDGGMLKWIPIFKDLGLINANPLSQITTLFEGLKALGITIGEGGGAAEGNGWAAAATAILPKMADAAKDVSGNIAAARREERLALEARIRAAQGVLPAAAIQQPGQVPQGMVSEPASSQPNPAPDPLTQTAAPSAGWIFQKIADQILRDRSGEEIGDWIDQIEPDLIERLKPLSADQIIEWLKTQPAMKSAAEHPRLKQTITELLAYANSEFAEGEKVNAH